MDGRDDIWPAMPDLPERDRGPSPDELGTVHVGVEDVGADIDQVRGQGRDRGGIVRLVDDENVKPGALQFPDCAPRRERHDRYVEPALVESTDEAEHMLLRPAIRSCREQLDDADPIRRRRRRSADGLEAGIVADVARAHQASRRTRMRWIGSSTAPHSYLYGSSPRRKSIRRMPRSSARRTYA